MFMNLCPAQLGQNYDYQSYQTYQFYQWYADIVRHPSTTAG